MSRFTKAEASKDIEALIKQLDRLESYQDNDLILAIQDKYKVLQNDRWRARK